MEHKIPLIFAITTALLSPTPSWAFGITPGTIANDRLLPGSTLEKNIFLTRTTASSSLSIDIKKELAIQNDWLMIEPQDIRFLPGETQIPLSLRIRVPKGTSAESYSNKIHFVEKKDESTNDKPITGNISLTGASLNVQLTVTSTKIKDFSLLSVEPAEVRPSRPFLFWSIPGKISFPLIIENTGNRAAAPKKIEISFYQGSTLHPLKTMTTFNTETIQPFATKTITPTIRHHLPPGEYTVGIKVFKDFRLTNGGEHYTTIVIP